MNQNIIELTGLTKTYGSFIAVDHLSLTIRKGEIYGLLGPNGAGKSTAILMMLGLTDPSSGSVKVCGIDSTTNPIEVKRKVGYLPEDVGFYDDYTGLENLIYTAQLNGFPLNRAREKAEQLLIRVGLTDAANKKTGKYSRGMRQRLGFADVLIKSPEVIILDEPTLGIDPRGVREFLDLIVKLSKEDSHTVLLSSHHLHQVQEVCDRVGLFIGGKLIAEGDIHSLSRKLFSDQPFSIQVGIKFYADKKGSEQDHATPERLKDSIKKIEGVLTAQLSNNTLHIGCSHDATDEIVRVIVDSGAGVTFLNKKEYGLDDIYNRFFEEFDDHE